jgi:uncharacterized protein YegJ (DUF2314 family)
MRRFAEGIDPMRFVPVFALAFAVLVAASARPQELSPTAPADKPAGATGSEQIRKFEEAIKPYVKQARQTLPRAKKKYLKGLGKGEILFVTSRLYGNGRYEQVFVRVTSWEGETIRGLLASDVSVVPNHKRGEDVTCKESEVLDWTISKPDGSEEGNFVGKFLDSYKP